MLKILLEKKNQKNCPCTSRIYYKLMKTKVVSICGLNKELFLMAGSRSLLKENLKEKKKKNNKHKVGVGKIALYHKSCLLFHTRSLVKKKEKEPLKEIFFLSNFFCKVAALPTLTQGHKYY